MYEPYGKRQRKDPGRGGPAELPVRSGGFDLIMPLSLSSYHLTCAPRPMMRPLRMPDGWLYVAGAVALAIE
jgi:hypothetical protein